MRRLVLLMAVVLQTSCAAKSQTRQLNSTIEDEAAILALEATKNEGYRRLDTALVGTLLAPEYVTVTVQDHGTGFGDRAKGIRSILEHRASGPPIEEVTSDSTRVRLFGDVAVVTGFGTIRMRRSNGSPFIIRDVYTDVWHRRGHTWLLVHTQHGNVERQVGARRYEPSWALMGVSVPLLEVAPLGADSALARYRELKEKARNSWVFDAGQLNRVGYWYLQRERHHDAIKTFLVNVEEYPNDGDLYDSLGEAYLKAADTTRAIANYRRALQLDSTNTSAARVLRGLTAPH